MELTGISRKEHGTARPHEEFSFSLRFVSFPGQKKLMKLALFSSLLAWDSSSVIFLFGDWLD